MENNPMTVGELRVLDEWPVKGGKRHSRVLCFCKKEFVVRTDSLKRKNTKSCGCLRNYYLSKTWEPSIKHHHSGNRWKMGHSPTYSSWNSMKNRCTNPKMKFFHRYGGRGIKVCDRWFNSFINFLEDMGEKPGLYYSVDRINNDGDYEPSNCQWLHISENARKQHVDKKIAIAKL